MSKRIAQLFRELANEFDTTEPTPPVTPPTGNKIPVRIFFYGINHSYKPPLDIQINGVWYDFSIAMDVKFRINSAVGTVIYVDAPIRTIALAKKQIFDPNLNESGFGFTNIKYGAVPSDDSLLDVNDSFWSRWVHGKAEHTSYKASLNRSIPDENFYKIDVPPEFNDTGKFAIYVSGYGENRP